MYPVLFRIPFPVWTLPLFWVFLVAAGVALAAAVGLFVTKSKQGALFAGGAAAVCVALAFLKFKDETWTTGPLPIYSYGVMLGLSLVVGWYLTLGLAKREGLPQETMANCYVVTAVAAVVGSRVLYILTNLHEFDSFGSLFAFRKGGLVAYGGFLGGFLGSYLYLRQHRLPLLPWADVAVPSLASGLMITRIGCYLFGCDFGQPLGPNAPAWLQKLGTFPHWAAGTLEQGEGAPAWHHHVTKGLVPATSDHSLPVHPTQLYEMLVGAGLLAFLLVSRKHQKFRGQIFLLFTFAYGFCRYLLEILRDDSERGSIPPSLPEHVLIPLGLAVFGVGYAIGFSKAIRNTVVQRVTQVLAFAPAVVAYVLLKPETFASTATQQYSTSQAVAVSTGFAASIAFAIFYKAALAHPETAMALNLPDPAEDEVKAAENEADEDEEEALAEAAKKPAKPAKAAADDETPAVQEKKPKKKKKKVKVEEDTTEDADKRPVKDDTTEEA